VGEEIIQFDVERNDLVEVNKIKAYRLKTNLICKIGLFVR